VLIPARSILPLLPHFKHYLSGSSAMADDFTKRQFQWLDGVAADPMVTAAGFLLAYRIVKHINRGTGDAWPSQATLAAEARLTVRSIRDLSAQLEAAGHLTIIGSRGRGVSCRYRWILREESDQPEPESEAQTEIETVVAPQDAELFPDSETAPKPAPRTKPKDLAADFEAWWLQYPRKRSKGAARKAYDKARKSATAEELELGAMRYSAMRSSEDPTYTMHGATWLNKQCWLDEPEPARGNFGERPQSFQRSAPLSHVEIALAGLKRDD
jgi:hypothetical protein